MKNYKTGLKNGAEYSFVCLLVDIADHSKILGPDYVKYKLKDDFSRFLEGIVYSLQGFEMSWQGDGSLFLFPCTTEHAHDRAVFAARRILVALPEFNRYIEVLYNLNVEISIRISVDTGSAIYATRNGSITGDFINNLAKHERAIGLTNEIVITKRIQRKLMPALSSEFSEYRRSDELECQLFQPSKPSHAIGFLEDKRRGTEASETASATPKESKPIVQQGTRIETPKPGQTVEVFFGKVTGFIDEEDHKGSLYLFTGGGSNNTYWPSAKIEPNKNTGEWVGKINVGDKQNSAKISLAVVNQEQESIIEDYRKNAKSLNYRGVEIKDFPKPLAEVMVKVNKP